MKIMNSPPLVSKNKNNISLGCTKFQWWRCNIPFSSRVINVGEYGKSTIYNATQNTPLVDRSVPLQWYDNNVVCAHCHDVILIA